MSKIKFSLKCLQQNKRNKIQNSTQNWLKNDNNYRKKD
jgi:hypothetical protein